MAPRKKNVINFNATDYLSNVEASVNWFSWEQLTISAWKGQERNGFVCNGLYVWLDAQDSSSFLAGAAFLLWAVLPVASPRFASHNSSSFWWIYRLVFFWPFLYFSPNPSQAASFGCLLLCCKCVHQTRVTLNCTSYYMNNNALTL